MVDPRSLIPSLDVLLEEKAARELIEKEKYPRPAVARAINKAVAALRENSDLLSCFSTPDRKNGRARLAEHIILSARKILSGLFLRPVINATGVILHTNLGRAPLPLEALRPLTELMENYVSLEMDLEEGGRSVRLSGIEELFSILTGAEDSLVVNNNAAAVLLILNTFSLGKEVIVSRGELVEIGGHFRLPDVILRSGALLREVGTTNRTYVSDYASAVSDRTALLMRTHPSNYRIQGYAASVSSRELASLGKELGIATLEDLGSGLLLDLSRFGLPSEETVADILKSGMDMVCFSGDKLLGGPQAGIILGKRSFIRELKANPLLRALRVDKFTIAVLEAILKIYLESEESALKTLPLLRMITADAGIIRSRARRMSRKLTSILEGKALVEVEPSEARIGGGSFPVEKIGSFALSISPLAISDEECFRRLLSCPAPVLARKEKGKVLLDLRTVSEHQDGLIMDSLRTTFLEDVE